MDRRHECHRQNLNEAWVDKYIPCICLTVDTRTPQGSPVELSAVVQYVHHLPFGLLAHGATVLRYGSPMGSADDQVAACLRGSGSEPRGSGYAISIALPTVLLSSCVYTSNSVRAASNWPLPYRGIERDHGFLKKRLRPMRGPESKRSTAVFVVGHALVRNVWSGFYCIAEAPND